MSKMNSIFTLLFTICIANNCVAGVEGIYVWKSGKATKELEVKKADSKNFEASFSMGQGVIGGCGGMIDGLKGKVENNQVLFIGENDCTIKVKFNKKSADVSEEGCSSYHGAACEFDGKYTKKIFKEAP